MKNDTFSLRISSWLDLKLSSSSRSWHRRPMALPDLGARQGKSRLAVTAAMEEATTLGEVDLIQVTLVAADLTLVTPEAAGRTLDTLAVADPTLAMVVTVTTQAVVAHILVTAAMDITRVVVALTPVTLEVTTLEAVARIPVLPAAVGPTLVDHALALAGKRIVEQTTNTIDGKTEDFFGYTFILCRVIAPMS